MWYCYLICKSIFFGLYTPACIPDTYFNTEYNLKEMACPWLTYIPFETKENCLKVGQDKVDIINYNKLPHKFDIECRQQKHHLNEPLKERNYP